MRRCARVGLAWGLLVVLAAPVWAQLTDADIAALQAQGEREGWGFTVAKNPATEIPLEQLCGFVIPENWAKGAKFDPCTPERTLPPAFDWRTSYTLPPVRNQASCGSCWAFGTLGPLECNIAILDGNIVDLSEQWLVSCNSDGWGCGGGWWAHDYLQWKTDPCGGTGAPPESAFPYVAWDAPCNCPYPHEYLINDWAFIGNEYSVPPTANIKQAILDYGPVSVACYVNSAFQGYSSGIFGLNGSGCGGGSCNHAVTLVGWDDNGGTNGYWIMRNSWGAGWGEGGYMRITYGCSSIGYAACYVVYEGMGGLEVTPESGLNAEGPEGGPFTPGSIVYTVENTSGISVNYNVTHAASWLTVTNTTGSLAGHTTVQVTASVNAGANSLPEGRYTDTLGFVNLTNHRGDTTRDVRLQVGAPVQMFKFNMDANPGWATQAEWAFGQPTGQGGDAHGYHDPASGFTGTNVYGVNLNGNYSTTYGGPYYLTAGPLNLGNAKDAVLYFKRWLNSDCPPYVYNMLEASADGSSWSTLWSNPWLTVVAQNAWSSCTYDLPAALNYHPTVYIRWGYRISNGAWAFAGWNIDDVEIWAFGQPPAVLGDMNCDGALDFGDINPFVLALTDLAAYAQAFPGCDVNHADINGDGNIDFVDVNPFVNLLIEP